MAVIFVGSLICQVNSVWCSRKAISWCPGGAELLYRRRFLVSFRRTIEPASELLYHTASVRRLKSPKTSVSTCKPKRQRARNPRDDPLPRVHSDLPASSIICWSVIDSIIEIFRLRSSSAKNAFSDSIGTFISSSPWQMLTSPEKSPL